MKKLLILLSVLTFSLTLTGCNTEKVEIPDLIGLDYGDVVKWSAESEVNLVISSEYNDDVVPNSVFYQSIEPGTMVKIDSDIEIIYSRGYDPNTEIVVPDFSYKSKDTIIDWLSENDIKKYNFADTYNPDVPVGSYVGYEVTNLEDRTTQLRKDTFNFYFSRGNLEVETVEFDQPSTVRGVNLGGWFVLEGWMTPDLFNGIDGSDETAFMQQMPDAATVLENHWDTFITEDDFQWLSDHGVDFVRIPIPWWYQGVENAYEGTELEVDYADSTYYIDRAMVWAETYGIDVLLDLHTAPGCQNGFDNGGIAGVQEWGKNESTTNYVATTVEVLGDIAEHFSQFDSLWGIELLNEPGWGVDMNVLQTFYEDAYHEVRAYNSTVWIGMHDGFRGYLEQEWKTFFYQNLFSRVFFDIHLYQTFGDFWGDFDIFDHLDWVEVEQTKAIRRYDNSVPVIVGEWSLGLQGNVYEDLNPESITRLKKAFGNAQLNVYETGMGWFFWNYKIDANSHMEWDFRRLVEAGIFPTDFSPDN